MIRHDQEKLAKELHCVDVGQPAPDPEIHEISLRRCMQLEYRANFIQGRLLEPILTKRILNSLLGNTFGDWSTLAGEQARKRKRMGGRAGRMSSLAAHKR